MLKGGRYLCAAFVLELKNGDESNGNLMVAFACDGRSWPRILFDTFYYITHCALELEKMVHPCATRNIQKEGDI